MISLYTILFTTPSYVKIVSFIISLTRTLKLYKALFGLPRSDEEIKLPELIMYLKHFTSLARK